MDFTLFLLGIGLVLAIDMRAWGWLCVLLLLGIIYIVLQVGYI